MLASADKATGADVAAALARKWKSLEDFSVLTSPAASEALCLEEMARQAHDLTLQHFGRNIRLFAPLYLSNECINQCRYCGFARRNTIARVTLSMEEVTAEARCLRKEGFRHILLVAGEHPRFVSGSYLRDCVAMLHSEWPSISLEVGTLGAAQYEPIVRAGAEGLVIYQETYDRAVYAVMHEGGAKQDFEWRLETPERAYAAGFKRVGVGALLGLAPWRQEAIALAGHIEYLLRHCWRAQVTVSIPRLRPTTGEFEPPSKVGERDLVQLVCALRLTFPELGIVLSTRECARVRDGLLPLGITMISAGSHTEPGGYTNAQSDAKVIGSEGEHATEQFAVADIRPAAEVVAILQKMGYEPVWKDWDVSLNE
jgi:2-iminoacetate synthase